MSGTLLIIATPLGNLSDISARVKDSLNKCDFILAEDTRVSIKLLNHLGIKKRLISCHNFNEKARLEILAQANEMNQSVGLLSDAGTPLISDPGYLLVNQAIILGMQVLPIPGPSAFLLALIASGLPCNSFVFEGFLPDKLSSAKIKLSELANETRTIIFYVAPHKLHKTLKLLQDYLGDRQACLARELTKKHEQFVRASISELKELASESKVLGECVLVIAGSQTKDSSKSSKTHQSDNKKHDKEIALKSNIMEMLAKGLGAKEISKQCAQQFSLKRSAAYKLVLDSMEDAK